MSDSHIPTYSEILGKLADIEGQLDNPKRLGDLNGWYALAAKAVLVTYPLLLGGGLTFGAWVTQEVFASKHFRNQGPRVTTRDLDAMTHRIDTHITTQAHPGAVSRNEYDVLMSRLDRIEGKIDRGLSRE